MTFGRLFFLAGNPDSSPGVLPYTRRNRSRESWWARPQGEALYGGGVWVLLLLTVVELGCIGLWAATGAGVPLLAALTAGLAIVYLVMFSGR